MKNKKILYITFIDDETSASSASQFRPRKMLEAFENLGCEIRTITGITNNRKKRMSSCRKALDWLSCWRPDLCYIEPPSGPLFFKCDRELIKKIHKMNIPIGLFYRDIYWRYTSEIRERKSFKEQIKSLLIYFMQKRDYSLFLRYCNIIYYPSSLMQDTVKDLGIPKRADLLPPGCQAADVSDINNGKNQISTGIFVGAATKRYGILLLIEAGDILYEEGLQFKIHIVCDENSWNNFISNYPEMVKERQWLSVHHLSAGPELESLYADCDFSIIPILKSQYNDFAFPVKLMDYLSHLLPVVCTNCVETSSFVTKNKIGISSSDNIEDFAKTLKIMILDEKFRNELRRNCLEARDNNLWIKRAEKIIKDLSNI